MSSPFTPPASNARPPLASRRSASGFAFATLLAGCAPPAPTVELPPTLTPSQAKASSSAAAAPQASAAAPAPPEPPEPAGYRAPPPREGAPGQTRGSISCGASRCVAPGEVCKLDEPSGTWRCEPPPPRSPDFDRYDYAIPHFECDDGTDCPDGETCCMLWQGYPGEHSACVERAAVNRVCRAELCLDGGARCPPGRSCVDGGCDAPDGPATCAGGRRCPADAPVCVKSPRAPGGFECAAPGAPAYVAARGEDRYECTRQSDCNLGETCSFVFGEVEHDARTFCSNYQFGFMGSLLCEVGGASFCGGDPDCLATMTCAPVDGAPPRVGVWTSK